MRVLVPDGVLAATMCGIAVVGAPHAAVWQTTSRPMNAWGYVLIVLATVPLVGRRRWPLPVLGVTAVTLAVYVIAGYPYGPVMFALVVAAYTAGARLPVRRSLLACLVLTPLLVAHAFVPPVLGSVFRALPVSGWVIVPWAVGTIVRVHADFAARNKAEELRDRAYEDRLRLAQEVHDVVGHGLAAISMQSGIALHVLDKRPDQVRAALEAINRTSRDALAELRATLAVLRSAGPDPGSAEADGRPAHGRLADGLERLDRLVARMAASGLRVDITVDGQRPAVPAAVDHAGYRIVQEALTNVLRHAGPATALVRVDYRPEAVHLDVADDGRGGTPSAGGHGIAGMRQRATALGGSLSAGPGDGGGFAVRARLPLRAGEPA